MFSVLAICTKNLRIFLDIFYLSDLFYDGVILTTR